MMRMRKLLFVLGPVVALSFGCLVAPAELESLVDAVKDGKTAVVQNELQMHGDPNAAEPDGTTALHWAVQDRSAGYRRGADLRRREGESDEPMGCDAAGPGSDQRQSGNRSGVASGRGGSPGCGAGNGHAVADRRTQRQSRCDQSAAGGGSERRMKRKKPADRPR